MNRNGVGSIKRGALVLKNQAYVNDNERLKHVKTRFWRIHGQSYGDRLYAATWTDAH